MAAQSHRDDPVLVREVRELALPLRHVTVKPVQADDRAFRSFGGDVDEGDALEMLQSYGQDESGLSQLSRVGFDTLGLQTYLTAGPKEARAWTIHKGATAPEAAGEIHTDFQKNFIKAEVIAFNDLVGAGSVAAVRAAGKARIEGKEYVMRDGDVVWIVDRLIDRSAGDAERFALSVKGIIAFAPRGIIGDLVTHEHRHIGGKRGR